MMNLRRGCRAEASTRLERSGNQRPRATAKVANLANGPQQLLDGLNYDSQIYDLDTALIVSAYEAQEAQGAPFLERMRKLQRLMVEFYQVENEAAVDVVRIQELKRKIAELMEAGTTTVRNKPRVDTNPPPLAYAEVINSTPNPPDSSTAVDTTR
ncbi:hypothetical protein BDQ12DRAFT_711758 [Crucibulum laeve]|uniref:Uncharacterized protein n=1 Tax=Crucibulum laeve TaxID=68775 RepID=A0A5C3M6U3_9AGAR|nr:hypothetical protein BDQ12DRAFT_711758 [Crucibulum laeve]